MAKKRRRLKGADAKARILDAATERLAQVGPHGLRLSALAKELEISHQAILHHFGSRDGLVQAVLRRALDELQAELAGGLMVLDDHEQGARRLLDRAFDVMVGQGYGKLLAHVALTEPDRNELDRRRPLQMLAQMAHLVRERNTEEKHDPRDTTHVLMLLTYSVLGAAVFEKSILAAAGVNDDEDAGERYREWLAKLVNTHLEKPSLADE